MLWCFNFPWVMQTIALITGFHFRKSSLSGYCTKTLHQVIFCETDGAVGNDVWIMRHASTSSNCVWFLNPCDQLHENLHCGAKLNFNILHELISYIFINGMMVKLSPFSFLFILFINSLFFFKLWTQAFGTGANVLNKKNNSVLVSITTCVIMSCDHYIARLLQSIIAKGTMWHYLYPVYWSCCIDHECRMRKTMPSNNLWYFEK